MEVHPIIDSQIKVTVTLNNIYLHLFHEVELMLHAFSTI